MAKKELKKFETVVYCDYFGREIILAKIEGTNLFQLFYRSAGLNDPEQSPEGSVYPVFGVCDPSFIFGNYLISIYEEIFECPYDMGDGWIFKFKKDKTDMETYWGQEIIKNFCLYLESIKTSDVAMRVEYATFMNICNDILINADDKHRFIPKAFKKDIVERLLSNIEM